MLRRIIVIRSGAVLDAVRVAGLRFDDTYRPVRISGRLGVPNDRPGALGFDYRSAGPASYCVRGECDDEDVIARLLRERRADVVGVYADPEIAAFPEPYCGPGAVGSEADVADRLGVPALRAAGLTGREVRVAIVDTGIDGRQIPARPALEELDETLDHRTIHCLFRPPSAAGGDHRL